MSHHVLVVDDEPDITALVAYHLAKAGYQVSTAASGPEAIRLAEERAPDLVVLDLMLPGLSGYEVLDALRRQAQTQDVGVIVLTARKEEADRIKGLSLGADDYLVKPFAPAELVARVHAMLRRVESRPEKQKVSYADISLDPSTHEARRGEMSLSLTVTEFNLLHMLLRHPRQVLERRQILNDVWGYDFGGDDNVLEIYIGYLRKKLEAGGGPRLIHTVRGVGYVLREE
jgi:two-component system response regulator MprA